MAEKKYYGIYKAKVSNIQDPNKRGRVRVQCPDVLGENVESAWCDPVSTVAYEGGGDFCVPKQNDGLWVMFQDGDPNRPVSVGGWWGENNSPLGEDYSNLSDTRIIKYADCVITMHSGSVEFSVGGNAVFSLSPDKIKIKADVEIKGDVEIDGDLKVTGTITSDDDVIADGISLKNHIHEADGGDTSKPK